MNDKELTEFIRTHKAGVAPMAGFTDHSFRMLCKKHGAGATVSEMVSAKAIHLGDKKSQKLMAFTEAERPYGIQLFGTDPEDFDYAVKFACDTFHPDFIDINMGCPAPKIFNEGAGSALMDHPETAEALVRAAVAAADVPVTAKIRAGVHRTTCNIFGVLLQDAGVSAIAVHGRTKERMYMPPVDLEAIKSVVDTVSIPVFGNGDIMCAEDARKMLDYTGCDGILVGRGALGNPFIFDEINAFLETGNPPETVSLEERLDAMREQAEEAVREKGEYGAIREMRKHCAYYMRGLHGAAELRRLSVAIETLEDVYRLYDIALAAGISPNS